ncbi:hypothetical protein ABW55_14320, partial [Acinetobacter sp. C15]
NTKSIYFKVKLKNHLKIHRKNKFIKFSMCQLIKTIFFNVKYNRPRKDLSSLKDLKDRPQKCNKFWIDRKRP